MLFMLCMFCSLSFRPTFASLVSRDLANMGKRQLAAKVKKVLQEKKKMNEKKKAAAIQECKALRAGLEEFKAPKAQCSQQPNK